uniref:Helicase C-terminal domain-containing protein n=1 Tax=Panagrolaimus sp. ES5 TaxID=591445 RepID=A0AC34EZA2_9BILA
MAEFRKETLKCRILVSVNVVGRGIDVEEMDYVINYEIPNSHDSVYRFIQRCGRTGRTRPGTTYTFYVEAENKNIAPGIAKVLENAEQNVPEFLIHGLSHEIQKSMAEISVNYKIQHESGN